MSKLFHGGIPTEGDVKLLMEAFPAIEPGQLIPYERVAEVIKVEHGAKRFRTVTDAWRRSLARTQNVIVDAVAGQGFRRLTEIERSQKDRTGWRQDQSRAARRVRDLARVDTRDFGERDQKTYDHALRVLQAHVEHTATSVRELAPPPPLRVLPKRQAG